MPRKNTAGKALRVALAAALLGAPACSAEIDPGALPWSRGETAPPAPLECDDLPALTPEELARPPRDVPLGKAAPSDPGPPPPFTVLPDVEITGEVAAKVEQLDRAYFRRTGEHLVVTSGTRDAARQAKAMYKMLKLGGDVLQLYRNKAAAQEIKDAYDRGAGRPPEDVARAMRAVIQGQIDRGVYISAHLRSGAADIRSRTMSPAEKQAFLKSVAEVGGVSILEEARPPHYHLQIE